MEKQPQQSYCILLAVKYTLVFCFCIWKCTTCDVIFMDWVTKWHGVFVWKWLQVRWQRHS